MFLLRIFTANPMVMLYAALAIAAASAASGFAGGWTLNGWRLGVKVAESATALAACRGSLAREQDANQAFAGAVEAQTASIRALEAATLDRDRRVAAAAEEARRQGRAITDRADALLSRPLPASAADDCTALRDDLTELIRDRRGR